MREAWTRWLWSGGHRRVVTMALAAVVSVALVALGVVGLVRRGDGPAPRTAAPPMSAAALHGAVTTPRDGNHPLLLGASAGTPAEVADYEKILGRHLGGVRIYKYWDSDIIGPDERALRDASHTLFISIKSTTRSRQGVPFQTVADAAPGTPAYDQMVRIAAQIKSFGAPVYLTYNHEPDNASGRTRGTPAQYIRAWQRFVTVLGQQGVRNARYVWTLTGWSFTHDKGAVAASYYPGDDWVDYIGIDSYNWYSCHETSWQSMREVLSGPMRFAGQHPGKGVVLMEWSSTEDEALPGRKAQWIDDATRLLQTSPYDSVVAALQWSGRNSNDPCHFDVESSSSAAAAWRRMGAAPAFGADTVPAR